MKAMKQGLLYLEDGTELSGFLFGSQKSDSSYGEVVFNTSLTGYQEILTDPSYYGQIICMTAAHIGNTGVNEDDVESSHPRCAGFVIRELCEAPSSWRSQGTLQDYLQKHQIPGLWGVDTRSLTRHLRTQGVVRGLILPLEARDQAKELLARFPRFEGRDLIGEVSTLKPYSWTPPQTQTPYKVVALDFGIKWNLLRNLEQLGCQTEVVPAKTPASEILALNPDGIFLSNGPGDPSAAPYAVQTVRELLGKVPIFGVCMGHQILALALGGKTYKLKFGHRGGNQPVLDRKTGRVEISSHNHGYSVERSTLPPSVEVTHLNLNDQTVEGIRSKEFNAFSVQYHPEACPGPHDSVVLFQRFLESMNKYVP